MACISSHTLSEMGSTFLRSLARRCSFTTEYRLRSAWNSIEYIERHAM
jgi:hypothetical protein